MRRAPAHLSSLLALLFAPLLGAQQPAFDLTIPNIMRGPEHYGREPQQPRFTADGQWIYFRWNAPGSAWDETLKPFRVAARTGAAPEQVTEAHMDSVAPALANGVRSPDRRATLVAANGDLWLRETVRGALRHRRLTQTNAVEGDARWSVDGREVLFVRENNGYALELATGLTRQLTDIRSGTAPKDADAAKGQRGALALEQRDLLEYVRDQLKADSLRRAAQREADARRLTTVWVAPTDRVQQVSISPDGKGALFSVATSARETKGSDVPNYITVDGYPVMIPGRTKVGDAQGTSRVGYLELVSGKVSWLELAPDKKATGGANFFGWSRDGRFGLLATSTADFKTRYLYSVSAADGALKLLDELRDSAWVAGPCFFCMGWTAEGRAYFVSEATGYSHLYSVAADGSDKRALTSGNWEVLGVSLNDEGTQFNLNTSEPSPFTRQAYRMATTGGARTRITAGDGGHEVTYAADGVTYADVYSAANIPPELFLGRVGGGGMARLTTSTSAAFRAFDWKVPPIVRIPGEDGTQVPARLYRPEAHGARPNGAAVIFVHGAGYLHNVHDWWSSYAREYMFHHLLASKGYIVLDIDYRGSAGYGRDWRTGIYRWMGGKDLDDHVAGSKYLKAQFGIDPERVGIYGGSYGGFITLMALFNKSEYFGAGAALRSVTDWASYNHGYTGRILNLPQDDKESYRRSSPIFFAEGLKDPLLIAHGMIDTNVQFQDVVQLAQRLIELGKTDWEMAVYPVEDHGFVRPTSWTDEYRRIFELFERTIGPNGRKAKP